MGLFFSKCCEVEINFKCTLCNKRSSPEPEVPIELSSNHNEEEGARPKVDKDDENNENVRREIGNRQLKHTDSNVYIGLPYLSYYVPRGRDYVPHLSDEHKTLVIDSWDFVPGFISEAGYKAFTDFVKLCPYYAEAFPFVKKKEEEFSHILCEHARKVTGEFGVLAKIISALKTKPPEKSNDQVIQDIMVPLGRRHVAFGSNQDSMEILGTLIYKSLMEMLREEEMESEKFERLEEAYLEFFKSIVYWLQFSFNAERAWNDYVTQK